MNNLCDKFLDELREIMRDANRKYVALTCLDILSPYDFYNDLENIDDIFQTVPDQLKKELS
jgi:hypothetical protein